MIWRVSLILLAAGLTAAEPVAAQSRFPGDSPRRGRVDENGQFIPIGTPGAASRTVRTFTIPQGGFGFTGGYYFGGPYLGGPFRYPGQAYGYPTLCRSCGGRFGFCGCARQFVFPPLVVDYRTTYGPQALMRFYGVAPTQNSGGAVANRPPVDPAVVQAGAEGILPAEPKVKPKPAGQAQRQRAWRFIDHGDRLLKEGRYREALSRYRKAISQDRTLGDAHFRTAWAELALGRVDRAATAVRRGLSLNPSWPDAEFVLEDLLNEQALQAATTAIARRLAALPNDANARLMLGVMHHFDGQPEAARKEFRRVVEITGGGEAARLFLTTQPEAEDARALNDE